MEIEIEENPNCQPLDLTVFKALGEPREIRGIIASVDGEDMPCNVVAVAREGKFLAAHARKIMDSGEAEVFLIYGAEWGIRIRPEKNSTDAWDFKNTTQWGESHKIYGSEHDILFKES